MKRNTFPTLAMYLVLGVISSRAATVYWDINGATAQAGGAAPAGNWGPASSTWGNSAGTAATAPWVDGDTAVFSAGTDATSGYTVTVINPVTVAGLIREEGTPTISATSANVFTFANGGLSVDTGTGTLIVNAFFAPANGVITKAGTGILSPGTSQSSFAGKWICNAGTLSFAGDLRIGILPGSADQITLNGGRLRSSTGAAVFTSGRGIVLGAAGGGFNQSVTNTWNGVISGTSGGNLILDGGVNTLMMILGGANTYDGNTVINNGSLLLGASGVIPDTSVVILGASGTRFDLNGFDETVKSISGTAGTIALGTRTLTINNPNGESFSSVISGVGGGKIIKNGSGKLTLSASTGTYDGGLTLNAGSVGIGANTGFGNGPLTINNSVTVGNTGTGGRGPGVSVVNLNGDLTFDDSFATTLGTFTWGNAVPWTIKGANRTIDVNTAAGGYLVTINGIISQDVPGRGLTKIGNGILALGATNTYSGDTIVNAGLLQLTGNGTIGDGTGTLHLSGGGLNTSATRVPGSAPVPNPIDLTTDAAITTTSAGSLVELNLSSSSIGGSGTLTFRNDGGNISGVFQPRFTAGGLVLNLPIVINNGASGATIVQSFNSNTAPAQIFNGIVSGSGGYKRTASAPNVGGDTIFNAANTYSGGATLGDGGIGLGISSVGSPVVTAGPIGTGTLTINPFGSTAKLFASGGPRVIGNAVAFSGSPLTLTGTDDLELTGAISLGASTRTIAVDNTGLTTLSGTISSTGGGLTKSGVGTLVVNSANTYSGDTTISGGTVILGNAAAIPSGAGKGNLSVSSVVDLNGKSVSVNGLSGSGVVSNGVAGPITLTVGSTNGGGVFSGTIIDGAGNLSLVKVGTNSLVLSGANTFSGSTTISNGTLVVSNAALGSSPVTIAAAGTLAGPGPIAGIIDLSGTISPGSSPGTMTTATENWNGGGHYLWQINNATNAPGADPGWDLLTITGGLNITAAATNKFTIDVLSLATNVPGLIDGFDAGASNFWVIAQVTDAITNFDANAFHVAQTGFSNGLGGQIFVLALDNDTNLVLTLKTNSAPSLSVPGDQTIDELTTLTVTNTATDPGAGTALTFRLVSPPAGMSIDPIKGVITWMPSEAQGPGVYAIMVVVSDDAQTPLSATNTFSVTVNDINSAPTFSGPSNQTIDELTTLNVSSAATDSDIPANTLTYSLDTAPGGMTIDPGNGAISWTTTEADGPGVYTVKVVATDNGTPALSATNTFTVTVNEVNSAPLLTVPSNQTINEQTLLSVSVSATDSDIPANTLTFSLPSAPAGMTIDPNTGAISWTPTEADGPVAYTIKVAVTDNGTPPLSVTNSFKVTVNELNNPPSLFVPADQTIDELMVLNVSATATDPDLPANVLTFSLGAHPAGITIVPGTGAISWTPTEAQGPSTNVVEVIVTDNGAPSFSVTNAFTVVVREVNAAPALTVPSDQTIDELTSLNVTNTARDSDIPANTLTFSLGNHPTGMTIAGDTGIIDWTPTEAQGPSSNLVEVIVTNDGSPAISTTNTFVVMVNEVNSVPSLTVPANQTVNELTALNVSASATDLDIPANALTYSLDTAPAGMSINSGSGAISWSTTEADGPGVYTVKVVVTDNGVPSLSATNTFTVTVNEVNSAPSLTVPANQTIDQQTALNVSASATDSDIPANTLTFSLPSAPAAMTIDQNTGAISWTPTQTDTPGVYTIQVAVTDNGSPALSVTNSFTVTLTGGNNPPSVFVPADQTLDELTALNVSASATDPDAGNSLTFSLGTHPTGMTIVPGIGSISWTPSEAQGPSTNIVEVIVTDNGVPPLSATNAFTVVVREVNSSPALTVPADQSIDELTSLNVTNTAVDSDLPANTLTFSLGNHPTGMTITPDTGIIDWTPTEAQGPSSNLVEVIVTDDGSPVISTTNTFVVMVNEINSAPSLTVPANQTISELTLLNVSASATDADAPANILTFSLSSAPAGMTIDPDTGVINWTPTEADGPAVYTIDIAVTDDGTPSLSVTNSFTVTVNEVNSAPSLFVPADQTLNELTALNVSASATDPDLPANTLTFSLGNHPSGMTIVPSTGAISWTPNEAQGPSANVIEVIVTDNGVPALSVTNTFSVTINEVNVAPALAVPADQTIDELTSLNVTNTATDADIPANVLTFSLGNHPTEMTITPDTGIINWTPTEAQGPSSNLVEVIVTDDGSPILSTTNTFVVMVNEVNSAPSLTVPANQTINEQTLLSVSATASNSDIPANTLTFSLPSAPVGMSIDPNTGAITWTPSEADGPAVYTVSVAVTDDGSPALSVTNSFTVTVNEVNTAPSLPAIANRTIHAGQTLLFTNSATDSDLPANVLTYSLDPGAPSAASVGSTSGVFTWATTSSDANTTNAITVRVTDDGTPALDDSKSFTVTVVSAPTADISVSGNVVTISWASIAGQTYRVQYKDNIDDASWTDLAPDVTASGSTASATDTTTSQRFYRITVLP